MLLENTFNVSLCYAHRQVSYVRSVRRLIWGWFLRSSTNVPFVEANNQYSHARNINGVKRKSPMYLWRSGKTSSWLHYEWLEYKVESMLWVSAGEDYTYGYASQNKIEYHKNLSITHPVSYWFLPAITRIIEHNKLQTKQRASSLKFHTLRIPTCI